MELGRAEGQASGLVADQGCQDDTSTADQRFFYPPILPPQLNAPSVLTGKPLSRAAVVYAEAATPCGHRQAVTSPSAFAKNTRLHRCD